jgi:hypothetical protein
MGPSIPKFTVPVQRPILAHKNQVPLTPLDGPTPAALFVNNPTKSIIVGQSN